MKLIDLSPKWFAEPGRHGQGVSFLCPHCLQVRLGATFANPLDGGTPLNFRKVGPLWEALAAAADHRGQSTVPPGFAWGRVGDTFETLTLSPSVDCSASGHWHGFVRNGEVV